MSRSQVQKYSVSPQINDNTKKEETSRTAEEPGDDRNKLLSLKCIMTLTNLPLYVFKIT